MFRALDYPLASIRFEALVNLERSEAFEVAHDLVQSPTRRSDQMHVVRHNDERV